MPHLRTALSRLAPWLARLALAAAFLSAVADRLGLWGPPGTPGVAWGSFEPFLAYTATINPWLFRPVWLTPNCPAPWMV